MINFLIAAGATFFASFVVVPILLGLVRMTGLFTTVEEGTCRVYTLFGKVVGVLDEPGLHSLWTRFGAKGLVLGWLGSCEVLDMRVDQIYLRSQPVNSEEGAPMGIGIWYEMFISDPVAYLFKNADPRGSLRANVSNATVRCLSNMALDDMLIDRRVMSRTVRDEVSPMSHDWGYRLGSTYIRKVHFRDRGMIQQIEEKVVNRLRQVTSAIMQDGENQVSIITSAAEREAAIALAQASALRPKIVGEALNDIARDPEIRDQIFEILAVEKLLESNARITLMPGDADSELMAQLTVAGTGETQPPPPTVPTAPFLE